MTLGEVRGGNAALFTVGPVHRRIRLITGCILFSYVATHFIDHSTGNISPAAMEAVLRVQKWIWQGAIGTLLLYSALTIHGFLRIWSLYARRYTGWSPPEVVQLMFGLGIPPLLANHVAVTRIALATYGLDKAYSQELTTLWFLCRRLVLSRCRCSLWRGRTPALACIWRFVCSAGIGECRAGC